MPLADDLARRIDAAADSVFRIRPLSRTEPHVFTEDKDRLRAELRKIAAELRNTFGGPAGQFASGRPVMTRRGREVRVETRKAA